jgi:hypothetical protein
MINGAAIAPIDCVRYARLIWVPLAERFLPRNVPIVTNHAPHMKKFKNIIKESCNRTVDFIGLFIGSIMCVKYYF